MTNYVLKSLKAKSKIVLWEWKDIWNPTMGGAEVYITRLAQRLVNEGLTVIYLTSDYVGAKDYEEIDGIHYFRKGGLLSQFLLLPLFYLTVLRNKKDILIEGFNGWPFFTPLLNRKSVGLIYHMQQEEYVDKFGKILGPIVMIFSRFFLKLFYDSKDLVTISPSSESEIKNAGLNPKTLQIIYPGVDPRFYEQTDLLPKTEAFVNLVYLGRLVEHKQVEIGIELVKHLVQDLGETSVRYHIVGKGTMLEDLQKLVESYDLSDYVEFHGFVSEEEKKEIFQYSHLHLLFSKREGWGITVIEAASQGTPTACFDVPGLRDSVKKETGYIFTNKENLYKNFDNVYFEIKNRNQRYLEKMKNSFEWAQKFTWEKQLNKWVDLIRNIENS